MSLAHCVYWTRQCACYFNFITHVSVQATNSSGISAHHASKKIGKGGLGEGRVAWVRGGAGAREWV